jgi:5-methylcytosine-specific restriction endonuclease McrA
MQRPATGMRAFTSVQRREIRAKLLEEYGPYCQICLQLGASRTLAEIDFTQQNRQPLAFSIDHIIALADGGTNTIDNMWPAHASCNRRKGSDYDRNRKLTSAGRMRQAESILTK